MIVLTPEQVAQDDADARRDHARATAKDWHSVGYEPPEGPDKRLEYRVQAYRAERAAALELGVDFKRDPNGFHKADVAGYLVRCASLPGYGLIARLGPGGDPPLPYLLVECIDPFTYRIVGRIGHDRVMELYEMGEGRPMPGTHEPWLIPQKFLRPMP